MKVENISIFDVKALYDAAFAEKEKAQASLDRYADLMAKVVQLDACYRAQLTNASNFSYGRVA